MLESGVLTTALIEPVGVPIKGTIKEDGFFYPVGMDRTYEVFIAEGFCSDRGEVIFGHIIDIDDKKKFFKWSSTSHSEEIFLTLVCLLSELSTQLKLKTLHIHTTSYTHSLSLDKGYFVGERNCCEPALCGFNSWGMLLTKGYIESVTDSQFIPKDGDMYIIIDRECLCVVGCSGETETIKLDACPACGAETTYEKEGICCSDDNCYALSDRLDEALIKQCPQLNLEIIRHNVLNDVPIDNWILKPQDITTNSVVSLLTLMMDLDEDLTLKLITRLNKGNYHWILDRLERVVKSRYGINNVGNGNYAYYAPDPDHFLVYVYSETKPIDIYNMILASKGYEIAHTPEVADIILFENKEGNLTTNEVKALGFYHQIVIPIETYLQSM